MQYKELVGVIGGLGPKASAQFYDEYLIKGRIKLHEALVSAVTFEKAVTNVRYSTNADWSKDNVTKVLKFTSKELKDQDHPPFILYSASHTADRNAFLLGDSKDSPVTVLVDVIKRLKKAGVTKFCFVCNTVHYFIPDIEAELKRQGLEVEFLNMIELTLKCIFRQTRGHKGDLKIGLLSTETTAKFGIYKSVTETLGERFCHVSYLVPTDQDLKKVMRAIYDIKAGIDTVGSTEGVRNLVMFVQQIKKLRERGCKAVILGCTEIAVLVSKKNLKFLVENSENKEIKELVKKYGVDMKDIQDLAEQKDIKLVDPGAVLADEVLRVTLVSRL